MLNDFHNKTGEKKDQLLITTDKKGNRLGTARRDICHQGEGITHLAFLAFIINDKGEVILSKRSKRKSLWSNFWDAAVVSHVLPGESVEQAANRRGKEEMGVNIKFKDLGAFYYFAKQGENCENEYCHVLIGVSQEEVDFNPVEIEEIKKLQMETLKEELKKNKEQFTPWLIKAIKNNDLSKYVK